MQIFPRIFFRYKKGILEYMFFCIKWDFLFQNLPKKIVIFRICM